MPTSEKSKELDTRDRFAEVETVDDLIRITNGEIDQASDLLGDGYTVLNNKDKDRLIGVQLFILDAKERLDDASQRLYWSMRVITRTNERFVVNDGGTGIPPQLAQWLALNTKRPLYVSKGLRRSDYTNEHGAGSTYYLDTSGGE